MGKTASLDFKIYLDSTEIKSGLAKVQEDFKAATSGISNAFSAIKGFDEMKRKVLETSDAYAKAQQKVADIAKAMKSESGDKTSDDFKKAREEAQKLKDTLAKQQEQLQRTRDALVGAGLSMTNLSGQQAQLRSQLDSTKQKYAELAKVASARETLQVAPYSEVTAQIDKIRAAYATLATSGKTSMAELAQAKVAMGARIEELRKQTNGWRESLVAAKMQVVEVAAGIAPMGLAIGQAIKFESSMADVRKVVDATPVGLQALRNELLQMTREIPLTANELAEIAAAGGQLGIASGDIGAFVKVTAKMATAFDMTAKEAGDSIGKIKNVYGLAVGDVAGFGDAINQLGNNTAARERDIVEVLLRIGGASKQFGLAKEQAAALSAAMLSLGKSPEVASTSINALLNNMQTATMQGATFQTALAKIGMSAKEMAAAVAKDPQKALSGLLKTLSQLSGQDRAEVLTGLFGKEFQDDIGTLVGSLAEYEKALGMIADQSLYAGAMNQEFATRSATTENQLKLLRNAASEAGINLGTVFLPAIRAVVAPITVAIQAMATMAEKFPILSSGLVTLGTGFLVFGQVAKLANIAKLAMVSMATDSVSALTILRTKVTGLSPVLSNLGMVVGSLAVGWTFGSWLNQFDIVKKAGITLAHDLTMGWLNVKKAWEWMTGGDTSAIEREMDVARQTYSKMMDEIDNKSKSSAETRVSEEKKVAAEVKQSAEIQQRVAGEALKAMQKKYHDYAAEVRRLQDDISGRERSLYAELRAMSRTGMSDYSAWKDQKKEAEEYAKAAKTAASEASSAMSAGDEITAAQKWKEALQYADDSKAAYKALNTEVKSGEQVIVSQQQALKTSMDGVKEAGKLGIDIQKESQAAFIKNMETMASNNPLAALTEGMDDAEKKWLENWKSMADDTMDKIDKIDTRLDEVANKKRTAKLVIDYEDGSRSSYSSGGLIGAYEAGGLVSGGYFAKVMRGYHYVQALAAGGSVRNILSGGHLPGFGGGDRRLLLGEDGEVMLNKYAVRAAGLKAALAFNAGRFDVVLDELRQRVGNTIGFRLGGLVDRLPKMQSLANGGAVAAGGDFGTINLSFPSGASVPVQTTRELARTMLREFDRMGWRASA